MKTNRTFYALLFAFALGLTAQASSAAQSDSAEAAARRYLAAEAHFDQPALDKVLAPGFVEISPRGEVDERPAVLSFYAPEKKIKAPPMTVSDLVSRVHGDTAVITARISFTMGSHTQSMTVGMSAVKSIGGWKLLSSQYTRFLPEPPKSGGS